MNGRKPVVPAPTALAALLQALRRALFGSVWDPAARLAWCRAQRRKLGVPGRAAVWVDRDAVAWAEWGAGRGYFLLERMNELVYLRAPDP